MIEQANPPQALNYMEGPIVRDGMADILDREWTHAAEVVTGWLERGLDHLYLVGCGGSFATTLPPKWLLDRFSTLPADRYSGWEFIHRAPGRLNEQSAVVLGSHSGTTEELLLAYDLARERGAAVVALSQPDTPLSRKVGETLTYSSPASNLSKLLLGYLLAGEILVQRDRAPEGEVLRDNLSRLPYMMETVRVGTEARSRALAAELRNAERYYVIGSGPLTGLAYQFAICNLIEMQWVDAAWLDAAEFQHGPLEIVQPGLPMIFLLGLDEARGITERALEFSRQYGARTIVFDLADMPGFHPWLAPFGLHLPLQWFNWYLGQERNHVISLRRYMGKVTF
jgi:fructoselysine 6-phosphate deglycase